MNNPDEMKQVIVWQNSITCRRGKQISQCCHASLKAILDHASKTILGPDFFGFPEYRAYCFVRDSYIDKWLNGIFTKITCRVESEKELLDLYEEVKEYNNTIPSNEERVPVVLITDSGLTEFHGIPTNTCIAIGPAPIELVDTFTKHLKLL